MRKELSFLWEEERPRVTQGVADAAAEGDRSENAEYIYGKKRLRAIDSRIRFLEKRLDVLNVVVADGKRNTDKIFFGAWVQAEDENGERISFRIVGPDETDIHEGGVSMDSPIGKAFLKKELDDEVKVRRPKGEIIYTVTAISYENGNFDD